MLGASLCSNKRHNSMAHRYGRRSDSSTSTTIRLPSEGTTNQKDEEHPNDFIYKKVGYTDWCIVLEELWFAFLLKILCIYGWPLCDELLCWQSLKMLILICRTIYLYILCQPLWVGLTLVVNLRICRIHYVR